MSRTNLAHRLQHPAHFTYSSRTVVFALTARKMLRSGVLWGCIFGISVYSSAISYTSIYKTQAERAALAAAYGLNEATSALFGPAPGLQTVAGFTAFKVSMTLMIIGALWGLLSITRLLRGEEDSGRWELLLSGQTTRKVATAQVLGGLAVGVVALWALTAVITVLTGLDSKVDIGATSALYFALAMVATAVMFVAVGALTSQLGGTRRQAASYAAIFLGLCYAVRMIADAGLGVHGLIWLSPLGWVEEFQPLTDPNPWALLPIVGFTLVVASVAISLAGRRDVADSTLPHRVKAKGRFFLLSSSIGLAFRMVRPAVVGWWVAMAVSGLLYGLVAKSAGSTISWSSISNVLSKLGARGAGAEAVLGVCFLVMAILVTFIGAGQLSAARGEEADGRLDNVLVSPKSRTSWLGGRLTVAVSVLMVGAFEAGIFAWLGTASQNAGVGFAKLLESGVNLIPPALVILGVGVLTFGIRPRMTSIVTYALLGWSLLVVIVGDIGAMSHWILDTSVFHQMALAPSVSPNWEVNGVMVGVGIACAICGGVAFKLRDLQRE